MNSLIFLFISNTQSLPTPSFLTTTTFPTVPTTTFPITTFSLLTSTPPLTSIPPLQREPLQSEWQRVGHVAYDQNYEQYYYDDDQRETCKNDEYEINIAISADLFSGTNDEVRIRLFSTKKEATEWFQLDTPNQDDFERMSQRTYCIPSYVHTSVEPIRIGILKMGHDKMKIRNIQIRNVEKCFHKINMKTDSDKWIKTKEEHFFDLVTLNDT